MYVKPRTKKSRPSATQRRDAMDIVILTVARIAVPVVLTFWLAARLRAWDARRTA